MSNIFGIFARSPIKPIEQHADLTASCCEKLGELFFSTLDPDPKASEEIVNEIFSINKAAKAIDRELLIHLPRGLFMPFDRADILGILRQLNRILAKVKEVSLHVHGRQLRIPDDMQPSFKAYLELMQSAARKAQSSIDELDELLQTGFAGREAKLVESKIRELNALDEDADDMKLKLIKQLHQYESSLDANHTIVTYRVIDWLSDIIHGTQEIGGRLLLMLAKA
ncbi:TIGR00153 family protein [Alteromonadaceae bacterium M269]|nr:TIGR00153 family protein [Alteromonadaceae bacterium M269]